MNAVPHADLAALAANRYDGSMGDSNDVWRILHAHEDVADFNAFGPKNGFETGAEADFVADMLNNSDGFDIGVACGECSNRDVIGAQNDFARG